MATTTNAVKLGNALKERRTELELTIKEVARRSGMTDSNVLRIERGDIPQPRPETLKSLADVLGLELSDLFNLAGYVQPRTLPSFSPYLRSRYADLPRIGSKRNGSQLRANCRETRIRPEWTIRRRRRKRITTSPL